MAPTVTDFLAALPPDRAAELKLVRAAIRKALPKGYEEAGAPKTTLTLHFMPVYASPAMRRRLEDGFRAAGKRLDMGVEIARSARKPKV